MNKNYKKSHELRKTLIILAVVVLPLLETGCTSSDGSPHFKDTEEMTIYESTKGTVTELEEVPPGGDYKILDERIIDSKEHSIAIVHNLDSTVDTVALKTLEKERGTSSHSALRGVLYYGLARSFFTSNMSSARPNSSAYKNTAAWNKSNGLHSDLKSSARTRTIKAPGSASRGYGSSKSFRSFGG